MARLDACQEIGNLMHEGVLVADLQPWHPPMVHVRLIPIGNVDRPPTANDTVVCMIEVFQPVQIVQIPANRRFFAVNFQGVQRLVPARVASRFKQMGRRDKCI